MLRTTRGIICPVTGLSQNTHVSSTVLVVYVSSAFLGTILEHSCHSKENYAIIDWGTLITLSQIIINYFIGCYLFMSMPAWVWLLPILAAGATTQNRVSSMQRHEKHRSLLWFKLGLFFLLWDLLKCTCVRAPLLFDFIRGLGAGHRWRGRVRWRGRPPNSREDLSSTKPTGCWFA